MFEYKVIHTTLRDAESDINRMAQEGWRVVATATISGCAITLNGTPVIVTMERETRI